MSKASWLYTAITFFITWGLTLTGYFMYKGGLIDFNRLNLIYIFGALGPFIGALISAKVFYGTQGVMALFSTFSFKNVSKTSLLLALSPAVFFCIGLLLYPLFTGHWYTFADTQQQFHLTTTTSYINWFLPFITYSFLEEFGWRGFLLPHLQQEYSALKSTTILTVIWASWHLPFFLWRFQFSLFITVGFFFSIFIGALIITSIFNLSKKSIVPVILFHLVNNLASALDKQYIVAIISTGFVFMAIYLYRTYKPATLSTIGKVKNFYLTQPS